MPVSPAVPGGPNQLWTATGTVETLSEFTPYGEGVVRLDPATLNVTGYWGPGALVNSYGDGDMGGTPNVFAPNVTASGCTTGCVETGAAPLA